MVLWGPRLVPPLFPPRVLATPMAGPRARSTSLEIPLLSGLSPTPLPPLPLPSSIRPLSTPGLRHRSWPVLIAPGIPWVPLTAASTFAVCTSRHSPPPLAPCLLMPPRRLSPLPWSRSFPYVPWPYALTSLLGFPFLRLLPPSFCT